MRSVGMILRDVREARGLSQRELAQAAGTSGPAISAYETGAKRPRADVLFRIVESSGHELRVVPRRTASRRLSDLLAERIAELVQEDPGLLDRALEVMDSDRYRSDYEQAWRHIVAAGVTAVVAVLTSTHPDSSALKSDSPFALLGLIDTDERRRLVERAHAA